MEEAFAHNNKNKYKDENKNVDPDKVLEPPDGGWGYVVCLGVGLTFMLGFGSSSAFGILFNDFFERHGGASGLTLVIGVYNGSLSLFGFLAGIALKRFSYRKVGMIGATLFIIGDLATIFVDDTYQLVISFGLIRGAGFGITIPVSYTTFNNYFVRKKTAMMSANQSMSSLASITFPILLTFLLNQYGFRGTLAIIFAIDLHMFVAMLVMQPAEWHYVEVKHLDKINTISASVSKKVVTDVEIKEKVSNNNEIETTDCEGNKILHDGKSIWSKIKSEFDFKLLKNRHFMCVLIGLGFAFVSDVTYLALEPMLLFSYGFQKYQVALCVMLGALSDFITRILLAIYTYFIYVDSTQLFIFGICVTMFLRIALVSFDQYWYVCLVTVVSGCVRCTVQVLFPLVLAKAAPDNFTGALALHIVFSGALMIIADPIIGLVYDVTGSYFYPFLAMSGCCLVCLVFWAFDKVLDWRIQKKETS